MPFTKETAKVLGSMGGKAQGVNKRNLWEWIANGGRDEYNQLLEMQLRGEKLNEEQEKAMDRVERLFPYVKAKKGLDVGEGKTGEIHIIIDN